MKIEITGIKTVRWKTVVEVKEEVIKVIEGWTATVEPYEKARQMVHEGKAKLEFDDMTENIEIESYREVK